MMMRPACSVALAAVLASPMLAGEPVLSRSLLGPGPRPGFAEIGSFADELGCATTHAGPAWKDPLKEGAVGFLAPAANGILLDPTMLRPPRQSRLTTPALTLTAADLMWRP